MDVYWERADDIGKDLLGIVKFEIIEIIVCACLRKCVMDLSSKKNSCSIKYTCNIDGCSIGIDVDSLEKSISLSLALDYGYVFTE